MTAGRICSRVMAMASPEESVRAAARRMAEYGVGTLVVLGGDPPHPVVGIITDRDIAIRCVADKRDTDRTPVSDVMTSPVQSVSEQTPIEQAISRMASGATRRLVVTGTGGAVVGILSLDDVLDLLIEETGAIGRLLEKQDPRIPV
jgi:CBS domain-containing protein